MMPDAPIAYHITFATYGTRLHGDPRGTVDREHNVYGEPFLGENVARRHVESSLMGFAAVHLSVEQCVFLEAIVPIVCKRGGCAYHVAAAHTDHVHLLISTPNEGRVVRRLLKRWLSQELSRRWTTQIRAGVSPRRNVETGVSPRRNVETGVSPRRGASRPTHPNQRWWAEGGSVKWLWKEDHLRRAFEYIERQRTTE